MTARDDLDRQLDAYLVDGPVELPEPSFYAVRDRTESARQRVVIGPWRTPDIMNKLIPIGLGAAAVVVVLVIGAQFLGFPDSGGVGGAPSAEPTAAPVGGTVEYTGDGIPSTTEVNAVADGTSVSGTAVSTSSRGTSHTVALECAARDGDTWAFGGTVSATTVPGEQDGSWSAVVVRDGTPQQIAIWLSDSKVEGDDCDAWLGKMDMAGLEASVFNPVESGELVPPPGLAP